MSDRELCHFTSKPISDEEDTLKSFMGFDITPRGSAFRVIVGSQIVVPQQKAFHLASIFHTFLSIQLNFLATP